MCHKSNSGISAILQLLIKFFFHFYHKILHSLPQLQWYTDIIYFPAKVVHKKPVPTHLIVNQGLRAMYYNSIFVTNRTFWATSILKYYSALYTGPDQKWKGARTDRHRGEYQPNITKIPRQFISKSKGQSGAYIFWFLEGLESLCITFSTEGDFQVIPTLLKGLRLRLWVWKEAPSLALFVTLILYKRICNHRRCIGSIFDWYYTACWTTMFIPSRAILPGFDSRTHMPQILPHLLCISLQPVYWRTNQRGNLPEACMMPK